MAESSTPTPPMAPQRPTTREHHGRTFTDPYAWMHNTEAPEFREYIEAENTWTEHVTAPITDLAEEIYQDVVARTQQTDRSVPTLRTHHTSDGPERWWYYSRTIEGSEYAVHCRVRATDDTPPNPDDDITDEQILLDGNAEAEGTDFFSLGGLAVSPDGGLLAYSVDVSGGERYTARVKDLATGETLPDTIEDTTGAIAWAGNDTVYLMRADEAWRPHQVLRHRLGETDADGSATEEVVAAEEDERFWSSIDTSSDDRWVVWSIGSKLTSEIHLLDTTASDPTFVCVRPREQGLLYDVEVAGDRLLILHNRDSDDFSLAEAPLPGDGDTSAWTEVIAPAEGVRLSEVEAHAGHVAIELRRGGQTGIHLMPRAADGDLEAGRDLDFDEPVRTVMLLGEADYATDNLRVLFTSLVTPPTTIDINVATGERVIRKQRAVLEHPTKGAYRPEDYVQERVWVTADDGAQVPMSIVRRADVPLDGTAPALLSGYGSYEICSDPGFSTMVISLLERGGVHAIAHIRGGGEMGRAWYDNGKMLHKRNTFTDFIACARHLVDAGYTSADRLAAEGGSAGGLLMGAVINMAPDAFAAVHAAVPFVDALTTILDPEMPLTVTEWEEWGNPLEDPEVYDYMASYSPYENLAAVNHPAILATTSLNDTRVSVVEPAKWIAALRALGSDDPADICLRTEIVAGHGGVSGRYRAWRERSFELAWLLWRIGAADGIDRAS